MITINDALIELHNELISGLGLIEDMAVVNMLPGTADLLVTAMKKRYPDSIGGVFIPEEELEVVMLGIAAIALRGREILYGQHDERYAPDSAGDGEGGRGRDDGAETAP